MQQLQRQAKKEAGADTSMDKRDARREVLAQNPKIAEVVRKTQQFVGEIQSAKLARAVNSERQLNEVMVDFWENHFSVFAGKGQTRLFLAQYDRDVIRPRALGKFRDLLGAVAKSPAMLFFLDNCAERGRQHAADAGRAQRRTRRSRRAHRAPAGRRRRRPRPAVAARSARATAERNARRARSSSCSACSSRRSAASTRTTRAS